MGGPLQRLAAPISRSAGNPSTQKENRHGHEEIRQILQGQRPQLLKPVPGVNGLEVQIADMMGEIAKDLHLRKPDEDDPQYGAYFAAALELECGKPPNLPYVHNVLAAALCRPFATRH